MPQNYKAVSYRLAELGVADSSRRKELVADAAAIVLGEDAKPQTPADWYQVMQAAEDIALEEAEKANGGRGRCRTESRRGGWR